MVSRLGNLLAAALLASTMVAPRALTQSNAARPAGISLQEIDFRDGLTPGKWAANADEMSKCAIAAAATDAADEQWKTDSLQGTLSLPKDFREVPLSGDGEGKKWMGADSSTIELRGTHALYRGNMGMGGMDIGRPLGTTTCALTLAGRQAPSHTLMLTRPAHGDTIYVDTPNTVVRHGVGLQFIILTNNAAREAQLLAVAQSLKVSAAKTP
ncbi:MAG: hypothetical protein ABIQ10_16340 [Gemmatimonadaceae bacterium]